MLHKIEKKDLLNRESSLLYSFRIGIEEKEYPQVHDFYEFTLVTEGEFIMALNDIDQKVTKGDLIFLPPYSIHGKKEKEGSKSTHINVALLDSSVSELCAYLYREDDSKLFGNTARLVHLKENEYEYIKSFLDYLSLFKEEETDGAKRHIRRLLVFIIYDVISPAKELSPSSQAPHWFSQLLKKLGEPERLYEGMDYMVAETGKTKEHICRCFEKYIGTTPIKYMNTQRLNWASQMLRYSNKDIGQISRDLGFCSISYFYKLFKSSFGLTPKEYREEYTRLRKGGDI